MNEDILDDDLFRVDSRPVEERELGRLRNWLARPNWCLGRVQETPSGREAEAVCLLAGVDPELTEGSLEHGYMWKFLPGAREEYEAATSSSRFDRYVVERIDEFRALTPLGARPVAQIISHALDAGFEIPWLDAALADDECRKYLPKKVVKKGQHETSVTGAKTNHSELCRQKAYQRWDSDDGKRLREGLGRGTFNEIVESDYADFRFKTGRINKSAIARHVHSVMEEEEPKAAPGFDTVLADIRLWFAELESEQGRMPSRNTVLPSSPG